MLELAGLSRQEIIVIKACAPDAKSFESVAATLVEQYSSVHLREGRKLGQPNLCNSGHLQTRSGKPSGYRPKGKGKTYKSYTADAWYDEEEDYREEDQDQEEDYNEASYQAFEDEAAPGYEEDLEGLRVIRVRSNCPKLPRGTRGVLRSWTCCTVACGST